MILGAWGCGVFGNDAAMVADLFASALSDDDRFRGRFRRVTFAVYDRSDGQEVLSAFRRRMAA